MSDDFSDLPEEMIMEIGRHQIANPNALVNMMRTSSRVRSIFQKYKILTQAKVYWLKHLTQEYDVLVERHLASRSLRGIVDLGNNETARLFDSEAAHQYAAGKLRDRYYHRLPEFLKQEFRHLFP